MKAQKKVSVPNLKAKPEPASSNPWGVDENKYYVDVGGIGDYLSLLDEPAEQTEYPPDHELETCKQILKHQKTFQTKTLEFDHESVMREFGQFLREESLEEELIQPFSRVVEFLGSDLTRPVLDQLFTCI